SHGHAPAIRVLRQPGVLPQFLARQKVPHGGLKIIPLAVDSAHAYVHVRRSPRHRATLAHTASAYVNDVIAAANNGTAIGDIGLMQTVIYVTGIAYLAGGFIFGIALFRANALARWASALLAIGTLATIAISIMPQYERLFAIPTGVALVGLGYSLWCQQRTPAARPLARPVSSQLEPAGAR